MMSRQISGEMRGIKNPQNLAQTLQAEQEIQEHVQMVLKVSAPPPRFRFPLRGCIWIRGGTRAICVTAVARSADPGTYLLLQ